MPMRCTGGCRVCSCFVRRWYFTFPAFGIIFDVVHLLTHREQHLSALQTVEVLAVMGLFATAACGRCFLMVEILAKSAVRLGK